MSTARSGSYGEHRRTGGLRRWSWLTIRSARHAGRAVHSCGSAPVLHRLPPPRTRDLPGSGTAQTIRGLRDRCRARTLGECDPQRQPPDRGTPLAWLGWALAGAATVQLAPSPVYVALSSGSRWLVVEVHAPEGPYRRAFPLCSRSGSRSPCSAS